MTTRDRHELDTEVGHDSTHYTLTEDTVHDNGTGLTWERKAGADLVVHEDAQAYCDALTLGGDDDWRLPGVTELATIIDFGNTNVELDVDTFSDSVVADLWFWTAGDWQIRFSSSYLMQPNSGGTARVRCVR